MSKFSKLQRRLATLAEIAADGAITQRSLASKLDISLGLANALLRSLESGRLIKSSGVGRAEARGYAITRAGRSAMQKMSRAFATKSAALLCKALGSRAKALRLVSSSFAAEAKRGR